MYFLLVFIRLLFVLLFTVWNYLPIIIFFGVLKYMRDSYMNERGVADSSFRFVQFLQELY